MISSRGLSVMCALLCCLFFLVIQTTATKGADRETEDVTSQMVKHASMYDSEHHTVPATELFGPTSISSPPSDTVFQETFNKVSITPSNDDCSTAEYLGQLDKGAQLGTCNGLALQSNSNASPGPTYGGLCYPNFTTGATVWYTFATAADVDHISVKVDHYSNSNLNIALLDLPSGCGTSRQEVFNLDIDDDYCSSVANGPDSLNQLPVKPNTLYYIIVNTPHPDTGSFDICVKSCNGPPNDKICNADPVNFHPDPDQFVSRNGNTYCASVFLLAPSTNNFTNFDCPSPSSGDPLSAVFYKLNINPMATGIEITGSNFSGTNNLTAQIFSFDDESMCPGSTYTVSTYGQAISGSCNFNNSGVALDLCNIDASEYDDLYLFIGTYRNDQGTFNLKFIQNIGPRNDLCTEAKNLNGNTSPPPLCLTFRNAFACSDDFTLSQPPMDTSDQSCFVDNPGSMNTAGVWYEFQTQSDGELLDLTINHTNMQDVNFALYKEDPDCSNLLPVLCKEDDDMDGKIMDIIDFLIDPNSNYLLYIYTDQSIAGPFEICYDIKAIPPCEGSASRYFNQTIPICDLTALDDYCLDMVNTPYYQDLAWPGCGATLHDPNWFTFIAGSDKLELEVEVLYCVMDYGIQIEMYELPCNIDLGPGEPPIEPDPSIIGPPIAGCQYATTPQLDNATFFVNTTPGNLYGLVIDGWSGDLCHVEVNVKYGDDPPILDNSTLDPPTYPNQGFGFVEDTVCTGATDIPFNRNGIVTGACKYIWSVDGNYLPSQSSDSMVNITFADPGIYDVCVSASNYCDTSAPVCTEVVVMDIPPEITRDTVCEGDFYTWYGPSGQVFGEFGPLNIPGDHIYQESLSNSYGCTVPYELHLFVRNENEENPSQLDTFTCVGDLPFDLFGTQIQGPVTDETVQTISQNTSCDTFFSADVTVFGGNFFLQPTCDGSGNLIFTIEFLDEPSLYTPWSEQFQILENFPDYSVDYEWIAVGYGVIPGDTTELTIKQPDIEKYAVGGVLTLQLRLIMSYNGEVICESSSEPYEYDLDLNFPNIISILGDSLYCPGQDNLKLYAHAEDPPAPDVGFPDPVTFYHWEPPTGFTVQAPSTVNSDTLILKAPDQPRLNTLCVIATTGSCMFSDTLCIDLEIDTPAQPILANDNETCDTFWTFSPVMAQSGQWQTIDGPAPATFSNESDPQATVSVQEPGSYTFRWGEGPPTCAIYDTISINFLESPQVSSYSDTCYLDNKFVLTVELEDSNSNYDIHSSSTISGEITGNTFVSDTIPISSDTLTGNYGDTLYLVVEDDKGCVSAPIPIILFCGCQSQIGQMSADTLMGCDSEVLAANYMGGHYNDGDDTLMFVLHTGSSTSLGTVLDTSFDGRFSFQPSSMSFGQLYYISMVIGNARGRYVDLSDPCLKLATGQPAIWYESPEVTVGKDTSVCGYSYTLQAMSTLGDGVWKVDPPNTGVTFSDPREPNTQVSVNDAGDYTFRWIVTHEVCKDSVDVNVTFLGDIQAFTTTNCNEQATEYDIKIVLAGGGGNYILEQFTDSALADSLYIVADTIFCTGIPKDSLVTFTINNDRNCGPLQLDVTTSCICETTIGNLSGPIQLACPQTCINTIALNYDTTGQYFDANDTLSWVLHSSAEDTLLKSNFIAQKPSGEFCYNDVSNSVQLGDTIYLSRIAGNHTGGGQVDINDACQQITYGIPVVFKEPPLANGVPEFDSLTCSRTSIKIDGSGSTGDHLDFLWTADSSGIISGPTNGTSIIAAKAGRYTLTVTDTLTGCTNDTSIMIYKSKKVPEAIIVSPDTLTCNLTEIVIDGSPSTSGFDISYEWSGPGLIAPFDQNTVSVNEPGTYTLTVTDLSTQCKTNASVVVSENVAKPIAATQVNGQLSCAQQNVIIDAAGSSMGGPYTYQWSSSEGNIIGNTNGFNITATKAGTYILEVSNTVNGCIDSAIAIVSETSNTLSGLIVTASDPECHNEINGRIQIQAEGGATPIEYRLKDVASNSNGQFSQLAAGEYFIKVEDANGCLLKDTVTLVNPPPLTIDLSESVVIEEGDTVIIEAVLPADALYDTLMWDTDHIEYQCLNPDCSVIQMSPSKTVEVIARVLGGTGCSDQDEMQIIVKIIRDVYIPNIFSPDGDGKNDVFLPETGRRVNRINEMQIFDRWGTLVFEQRNFQTGDRSKGWNGTFKGKNMEPAVFVYKIEVEYDDGFVKVYHGTVFLNR